MQLSEHDNIIHQHPVEKRQDISLFLKRSAGYRCSHV